MSKINFEGIAGLLKESFLSENAVGINYCVQLEIAGENIDQYYLQIRNQKCDIEAGTSSQVNASIQINDDDILKLIKGELNPALAYFTGRIKVSGDQSGLLKLASLFNIDKEKISQLFSKYE